jgi:uncharacterized protein (DUF2062 family)
MNWIPSPKKERPWPHTALANLLWSCSTPTLVLLAIAAGVLLHKVGAAFNPHVDLGAAFLGIVSALAFAVVLTWLRKALDRRRQQKREDDGYDRECRLMELAFEAMRRRELEQEEEEKNAR